MLYYLNKNLIEDIKHLNNYSTVNNFLVIHGCNCFCTFGAGIAYQIKLNFPEVYNQDLKTKSGDITKLGKFSSYKLNNKIIFINAYTQYGYGNKNINTYAYNIKPKLKLIDKNYPTNQQFTYCAFKNIILNLNELYPEIEFDFRIPKIGSGLAGGNWNIIEAILTDLNKKRNIYIYYI